MAALLTSGGDALEIFQRRKEDSPSPPGTLGSACRWPQARWHRVPSCNLSFPRLKARGTTVPPTPPRGAVWRLRDVTHEKCPAGARLTGASRGPCLLMRRPVQPSWAPWLSRCLWNPPWGQWALGGSARLPPSPTLTAFPRKLSRGHP